MLDQRLSPDPAWTAMIHDVLDRLPVDPATGKRTTEGISDRRLRQVVERAERAVKR